jgi:hypothetical protein
MRPGGSYVQRMTLVHRRKRFSPSGLQIAGAAALGIFTVLFLLELPDLKRYIRLTTM